MAYRYFFCPKKSKKRACYLKKSKNRGCFSFGMIIHYLARENRYTAIYERLTEFLKSVATSTTKVVGNFAFQIGFRGEQAYLWVRW